MKYQAILAAVSVICCVTSVQGQVTDPTNVPNTNHYVGFNGNSIIPLPIENIGYPDINISSNGNNKFAITELPTWNGLNGLTRSDVQRTTLGLQGETNTAWSMLHLWSDVLTQWMQRDWMNVGVSYTANQDFMYTGLLERPVPGGGNIALRTDAVVAWGCQDGPNTPDNLRFLFLRPTWPPAPGPPEPGSSEQGLETMRITPNGNVGIGDFSHMPSGLNQQPTQKLDVDGTARLRQMPNNTPDVVITGVEADAVGDYVLNYTLLEDFVNEIDLPCDWDVIGNNVAMGYPTACVTDQMLVGTAQQTGTNAKVFMTKDYSGTTLRVESITGGNSEMAGSFLASNGNGTNTGVYAQGMRGVFNYGVKADARQGTINYGTYAYATDASMINFGLYGHAQGSTDEYVPVNNVGVYGAARGYASEYNFGGYFIACDAERENYGVYAETCDEGGIAVYAVGTVFLTNQPLTLSDESVKNTISSVDNATELISQLQPKQYQYNADQFAHLNLPTETSYGFVAQEVQAVLPNVVAQITHPAKYDTTGEMISPEENLLGIKYQEFIAILTAGIKEQQAQIQSQDDQIAGLQEAMMQMQEQMQMMQDQINGCCQGDITPKNSGMGQDDSHSEKSFGQNELYQNTPNPFRSQTTISYTLEQGGKVLLNIFDKTGKPIATMVEAEQPADTYRYEWDATGLPAGLYHYALYVDGELLVKKAIKLAD